MNERPTFEPHEAFDRDFKGNITRKAFIEFVRNSHDHMMVLERHIKRYDLTFDEYMAQWDGNLENLDDDIVSLLHEWIEDGTFADIINEDIFKTKADQVDLENVTAQLAHTKEESHLTKTSISGTMVDYSGSLGEKTEMIAGSQNVHRGFTTMTKYNDEYYIFYRTGTGHASFDGKVVYKKSSDSINWSEEIIVLEDENVDYRDPAAFVYDGKLVLKYFYRLPDETNHGAVSGIETCVIHSIDGVSWSVPVELPSISVDGSASRGNVLVKDGKVYTINYTLADKTFIVESSDLINWTITTPLLKEASNEGSIAHINGKFVCVLRPASTFENSFIDFGTSTDGIDWEFKELQVKGHAPSLHVFNADSDGKSQRLLMTFRDNSQFGTVSKGLVHFTFITDRGELYATRLYNLVKLTDKLDMGYADVVVDGENTYISYYAQGATGINTPVIWLKTFATQYLRDFDSFPKLPYIPKSVTDDAYGVEWDFISDTHTRLGKAVGLSGGSSFNNVEPFSNRKRCNLSDDGTVNAYYGDVGYNEDGSNGQVMVEHKKFYYKREFTNRAVREWVSPVEMTGFKVHPAFVVDGVEVEYIYTSAYEGAIYDVSASAYLLADEQVADFTTDKLSSIANAKPVSGETQLLHLNNSRSVANNRGPGWGLHTYLQAEMTRLLMHIEYATFNMQTAIGLGVTGATGSVNTGATASLGDISGMATGTDGQTSITYRGEENFWGNMYTFVDGINIKSYLAYINESNSGFESAKFDAPYVSTNIVLPSTSGYVKKIKVTNKFDFLYLAIESGAGHSTHLTDYIYATGADRVGMIGGTYNSGTAGGAFTNNFTIYPTTKGINMSARLSYFKV